MSTVIKQPEASSANSDGGSRRSSQEEVVSVDSVACSDSPTFALLRDSDSDSDSDSGSGSGSDRYRDGREGSRVRSFAQSPSPPESPVSSTVRSAVFQIASLAAPAGLSLSLEFLTSVIALRFVGNYNHAKHLSGTGLALCWINISLSISVGVLDAMATLIPQAMGDKNPRRVGAVVQRGVVVGLILATVLSLFMLLGPSVFSLIGQHPADVHDCRTFLWASIPSTYPLLMYYAMQQYLQGQKIWWPAVCCLFLSCAAQVGCTELLMYGVGSWEGLGFIGAAVGLGVQRFVIIALLLIATVVRGDHKPTWNGWSRKVMFDRAGLKEFIKLGLPAGFALLLESIGFQALTIIAGYLGRKPLAAMVLVSQVYLWFWYFYLGISISCAYLVGTQVGGNRPQAARRAALGALIFTFCLSLLSGALLAALGHEAAVLLSADPEVRQIATMAFRYAAVVHVVDVFQCIETGILLGVGRPTRSAIANILAYYFCAVPLASALVWGAGMKLSGIWISLGVATAGVSVAHALWFFWFADWELLCKEASARNKAEQQAASPEKQPLLLPMSKLPHTADRQPISVRAAGECHGSHMEDSASSSLLHHSTYGTAWSLV